MTSPRQVNEAANPSHLQRALTFIQTPGKERKGKNRKISQAQQRTTTTTTTSENDECRATEKRDYDSRSLSSNLQKRSRRQGRKRRENSSIPSFLQPRNFTFQSEMYQTETRSKTFAETRYDPTTTTISSSRPTLFSKQRRIKLDPSRDRPLADWTRPIGGS